MKKTKLYNDLSPELVKSTMLKSGQTVIWRITKIKNDPHNEGRVIIPAGRNVPPIDEIWDEAKQEYVPIAAVRSVDASGNHLYHNIIFTKEGGGMILLTGGRAVDQEVHSYLTLCNYNASNANRDTTKEAIFYMVDEAKRSEEESKVRNKKREALNIAADLSVDEVRTYCAALGNDDSLPVAVLRNQLETMADKTPEDFLALVENKQAVMKATINRGLSKGVLKFDEEQSRFSWPNGEAVLTVARSTGSDAVDELIAFCVSSAKGEKVYQTIQSKSKKP